MSLSQQQKEWIERAWAEIDEHTLGELLRDMASIPSPTGEERALAEHLTEVMKASGIKASYQPIDDDQGNAVGHLSGDRTGPDLLLYAPIDTAFSGIESEDCPWIGPEVPSEMSSRARFRDDGDVVGLGAENPKGYAACIVAAAAAVARSGVPLRGQLLIGLGAGGMPTNKRPSGKRFNAGQGSGCAFMLEQGVRGDFAVIAKPGYAVSWEEVGLCWFRVRIKGDLGYTGVRHVVAGRNPIVDAARVITLLEAWFPEYSDRNASGLVRPQGSINAAEAGWKYKPAFVPAACDLFVDLRISPRTTPTEAKRQFDEALVGIQRTNPELRLETEMILAIPGTTTDPENWIIQSAIGAWEHVEGTTHKARTGTSGATDANILRAWGIPTARLGMPRLKDTGAGQRRGFSMEVSNVAGMKKLTQCLVHTVIDTCTRTRNEVGL